MLGNLKQQIVPLITAPEFNMDFLWGLSYTFLTLTVIYFIGIFFLRNKIRSNAAHSKEKKMQFSPMISEFLFYEDTNDREEKKHYLNLKIQIRDVIKDSFDRRVLTEVLLDLRKDLSGESIAVLMNLYKDLGLHNDSFEKLKSRKWQVVAKGILELSTMEVKESYVLIKRFLNHRQSTIRKQAEIAVVNLNKDGISYFLDNTKHKISEWEQLKLLDVLRHKANFQPPQFSLWLTSTNIHVVLFALRLIRFYKQSDAEKSIITLLRHKSKNIQLEALDCIKEFYFTDALPMLKLVYTKARTNVKIAILDTIGEIGSDKDIEFLQKIKVQEKNFNVKNKVSSALNSINPESILPTKNIEDVSHYETNIAESRKEKEGDFITENIKEVPTEEVSLDRTENHETLVEKTDQSNKKSHVEYMDLTQNNEKELLGVEKNKVTTVEQSKAIDFSSLALMEEGITNDKTSGKNLEDKISRDYKEDDYTRFDPLFSLDDSYEIVEIDLTSSVQVTKENDEIDWFSYVNGNDANDKQAINLEDDELLVSFENDSISFSANFIEKSELETMVLLENIGDMGDFRELPLLEQLLKEETSTLILERTKELITKFSRQLSRPEDFMTGVDGQDNSVFTDIFNLSDLETKLILLEEIKNVGGAKEIILLQSLLNHKNRNIAKKAGVILEIIKNREDESNHIDYDDTAHNYDLSSLFEIDLNNSTLGSTMFDDICSKSKNLYNKFNG